MLRLQNVTHHQLLKYYLLQQCQSSPEIMDKVIAFFTHFTQSSCTQTIFLSNSLLFLLCYHHVDMKAKCRKKTILSITSKTSSESDWHQTFLIIFLTFKQFPYLYTYWIILLLLISHMIYNFIHIPHPMTLSYKKNKNKNTSWHSVSYSLTILGNKCTSSKAVKPVT